VAAELDTLFAMAREIGSVQPETARREADTVGLADVDAILARQLNIGSTYLKPGFRVSGPFYEGAYSQLFRLDVPGLPVALTVKVCRDPADGASPEFARFQYDDLASVYTAMQGNAIYRVCRPFQLIPESAAIVQEWAPGRALNAILADKHVTADELILAARSAGSWSRAFHEAGPLKVVRPPAGDLRREVDSVRAKLVASGTSFTALSDALSTLDQITEQLANTGLEYSWLHGDLQAANIVIGPASVYGLDITSSHEGFVLADIAHLLNHIARWVRLPKGLHRYAAHRRILASIATAYSGEHEARDRLPLLWFRTLDHIAFLSRFYRRGKSPLHDRYFEMIQLRMIAKLRREIEALSRRAS
jgi:hypothetical protein